MLNVAMISKWHVHADGYAKHLQSLGNVKITSVWDEVADRGRDWADQLGADFEADLDALLRREDVDGVVVDAPTSMHADVMVAAAEAGKHIFTEKAMALTVSECDRISTAVRKAGVKFCISFPARTRPHHLLAKQLMDDGLLGAITLLRIRNGHDGALNNWLPEYWYDEKLAGGGAMMDLGCHPMYLASWLLGQPKRITSMFSHFTGRAVEDNAQCSIEFAGNAVALLETSLVTYQTPPAFELYGTEGTLIVSGDQARFASKRTDSPLQGWISPRQLPKEQPLPLTQWVNGILNDGPMPFGLEDGTKLTELLETAYIAHREKRTVDFKQSGGN
ncbi:Gfo/Idh/MocA family protein [Paenibacillus arenilitoris]|uniref:Gfo/Idh/MocA family oxidoreductase n=1 Tax=Paenibacillus arenilitoris TaxID=2772299 RepID=A0A927CKZ6_9BACL|nr:Gfo/Idh/MocA family oxidoreductase [Paenibacillus arenilitoris]MBD2869969.1 Gfo/Idh/MocA family oxidoreductase [Paenibacillus arenilitoris]